MKAHQIVNGLGWSTLATLINVLAQFVFMAILARHVEPAAFGLMLMANVALRFVSYFAQMGTTQSLIQRANIDAGFTTAALVGALSVSTVLYLVVGAAGPLFAWYFKSPELPGILWTYGITLLLSALGGPPIALLRRHGRFKLVNVIEVLSYILGYGLTGVVCALNGLGVWSLVAAALVQQSMVAVLALAISRYPLAWPPDRAALRSVFNSGSRYSLIGFLEFLWGNVESLFVGRWLGSAPLGLFNRAQMLTNLPVEQAVGSVNKVMFPALSAMQQDKARMADGFLVLLLATGTISAMLSGGIAAAADDVVALLLGSKWSDAAPVVAVLALGVPAAFVYSVCGITLDSLAVLDAKLRMQAVMLAVKVVLVWALWSWGLPMVAVAVCVAEQLRMLAGLRLMGQILPLDRPAVIRVLLILLVFGSAVYGSVALAAQLGRHLQWGLPARLLLDCVAGMAVSAMLIGWAVRRGAGFAPLARFEALRLWHQRAHQLLFERSSP